MAKIPTLMALVACFQPMLQQVKAGNRDPIRTLAASKTSLVSTHRHKSSLSSKLL